MSPSSRRKIVSEVQQRHGVSQRHACNLFQTTRPLQRYLSRKDDEALHKRLIELSHERRRFGYRRLHILLKREGWAMNLKKTYRNVMRNYL